MSGIARGRLVEVRSKIRKEVPLQPREALWQFANVDAMLFLHLRNACLFVCGAWCTFFRMNTTHHNQMCNGHDRNESHGGETTPSASSHAPSPKETAAPTWWSGRPASQAKKELIGLAASTKSPWNSQTSTPPNRPSANSFHPYFIPMCIHPVLSVYLF